MHVYCVTIIACNCSVSILEFYELLPNPASFRKFFFSISYNVF